MVKRGHPETLVLHRLNPKMSEPRAPGPGAIRKVEWAPLANKWLKDKNIILHTDAAKSYKLKLSGIVHDQVIHCKKKMKVNGKWPPTMSAWSVTRFRGISLLFDARPVLR